jgi:hypothetical protein
MLNRLSPNVQTVAYLTHGLKINPAKKGATCGTLPAYRNSGTGKALPKVIRGILSPV